MRPDESSPAVEARSNFNEIYSAAYEELRRLASLVRRSEVHATLNSTALVNEAWMKLKDSPRLALLPRDHFKSIAARAMRQILVTAARRRTAIKRGGDRGAIFVTLDDSIEQVASSDRELLALDAALDELARMNPRQANMVECRFFAGLSEQETADLLGVARTTVQRDWVAAKAFLDAEVRRALSPGLYG